MALPCRKCGGEKPPGRGFQYCAECTELAEWQTARRRQLKKRHPCARCGGPKPSGRARTLCDRCKQQPAPQRMCAECGKRPPHSKRARYCAECAVTVRRRRGRDAYHDHKQDVEWWQQQLESRRKTKALARRKAAEAETRAEQRARAKVAEPKIPARPLGEALDRLGERWRLCVVDPDNPGTLHGLALVCQQAGIWDRRAYGWRTGERRRVRVFDADDVITRLDLLWFDVYNEDTVRNWMFEAVSYQPTKKGHRDGQALLAGPVKAWCGRGPKRRSGTRGDGPARTRRSSKLYVDLGTDVQTLAEIERLFDGDPVAKAA